MTQTQLAEAAKVSLSTVVDFERERRQVAAVSVATLQRALEEAGVVFLAAGDTTNGVGVALRALNGEP